MELTLVVLGLLIFSGLLIWILIKADSNTEGEVDEEKRKEIEDKLNSVRDFSPTIKYDFNTSCFAFDEQRKLMCYVAAGEDIRLIPFDKIRSVKLTDKDGLSNTRDNKCRSLQIRVGFHKIKEKPIIETVFCVIAIGYTVKKYGSEEKAFELENTLETIIEMNKQKI